MQVNFMKLQLIVFHFCFGFWFLFLFLSCFRAFFSLRDLSMTLKCAFEIDFGLNRTNFLNSFL